MVNDNDINLTDMRKKPIIPRNKHIDTNLISTNSISPDQAKLHNGAIRKLV